MDPAKATEQQIAQTFKRDELMLLLTNVEVQCRTAREHLTVAMLQSAHAVTAPSLAMPTPDGRTQPSPKQVFEAKAKQNFQIFNAALQSAIEAAAMLLKMANEDAMKMKASGPDLKLSS